MELKAYLITMLLAVHLVTIAKTTEGVQSSDVKRLLKDKLASYDTNVRPIYNQSRTLDISLQMELVSIQGIDEVQERFSLVALFIILWPDEFMAWDPKDYGNVTEVVVNEKNIWVPNFVLINSLEQFESMNKDWNIIRVYSVGYALHVPGDLFSVSCPVDSTFYPWDTQTCTIALTPWGYQYYEIKLHAGRQRVATKYFYPNGAWDFVSSSVFTHGTVIHFNVVLSRKPTFVVVNVILPVMFMACLNILVFFIPPDSGERISYSITVLLAITVFLTIVGDNLPKTSNPMSLLSYFLVTVLGISVLIIICTIQSLRLYHRDDNEAIGPFWRCVTACMGCRCRKRSHRVKGSTTRPKISKQPKSFWGNGSDGFDDTVASFSHIDIILRPNRSFNDQSNQDRSKINDILDDLEITPDCDVTSTDIIWKDVCAAFDKIALIFFFILLIVSIFTFLIGIFAMKNQNEP